MLDVFSRKSILEHYWSSYYNIMTTVLHALLLALLRCFLCLSNMPTKMRASSWLPKKVIEEENRSEFRSNESFKDIDIRNNASLLVHEYMSSLLVNMEFAESFLDVVFKVSVY